MKIDCLVFSPYSILVNVSGRIKRGYPTKILNVWGKWKYNWKIFLSCVCEIKIDKRKILTEHKYWEKKIYPIHVSLWVMSISTAVVSGFHTQAHYGRRDSSAAQVGWSCSAPYQASQHQHSAELSCKLSAEWLLFFTLYKCSGVGNGWGAWWYLT